MKFNLNLIVGSFIAGLIVACSPIQFNKQTSCGAGCSGVSPTGDAVYDFTTNIGGSKVDILIVDDNSASMSFEQHKMSDRFSSFLGALDAKSIDYRIAITTTSISTVTDNSPYRDGNLVTYGDGSKFITPTSVNKTTLFSNAIVRPETFNCESFLAGNPNPTAVNYAANCPSPDERGIYAANLTVQNNASAFIRPDAALAVVFLSDEDVRSSVYTDLIAYSLMPNDMPQTLISSVNSRYLGKVLTMHALIVKPGPLNGVNASQAADLMLQAWGSTGSESSSAIPSVMFSGGDSACLAVQNSQTNNVRGSYGYVYALGARMTGGIEGDICASDYGSQLSTIGDQIGQNINSLSLNCSNAVVDPVTGVTFLSGTPVSWSQVGNRIQFVSNLTAGTSVHVHYKCPAQL